MIRVNWSQIKSFVTARNVPLQYIEADDSYLLYAYDGQMQLTAYLIKNPADTTDLNDFENNFKADSNLSIIQRDSDQATMSRQKTTKTGWHYDLRSLDFYTSLSGSLYNKNYDGSDLGDATIKFYNSSNTELVQGGGETDVAFQARLTSGCTQTVVDWQASYDMDILGGMLQIKGAATDHAYIWVIIAPDIAVEYGGSVPYFSGGLNLSYFYTGQARLFDGRGVKTFLYDPVYNSNKIRFHVKHQTGNQFGVQFNVEHFRF